MVESSQEGQQEQKGEKKSSWVPFLIDVAFRHAREIAGGVLALVGTIENDVRSFVMRFVREMVLGIVLLCIGFGFIVFGVGMMIVEALQLGSSMGSLVVGLLFVLIGSVVFVFSRR